MLWVRGDDAGSSEFLAPHGAGGPEGLRGGSSGRNPTGRADPQGASLRHGLNVACDLDGRRRVWTVLPLRPLSGAVLPPGASSAAAPPASRRRAEDRVRLDARSEATHQRTVEPRTGGRLSGPSRTRGSGVCAPFGGGPGASPGVLPHPDGAEGGERVGGDEAVRARRTPIPRPAVGADLT